MAGLNELNRYPHGVGLVQFSNPLAHKITAGSDFLLMPSRFEPCGLTQQHALLYGTVPIAHATGGLKDTVFSFQPQRKSGNGWAYHPLKPQILKQVLQWALQTFYFAPEDMETLRKNAMKTDRSWEKSAKSYEQLFTSALRYR